MEVAKDMIRETLDQAKAYLAQETPPKLSEADTKIYFLEPIILALGWEGLGVVTREYFVKSSQEFIDFMMVVDGQRLLAIEAKPLQSQLSEKNAAQLVQYCAVEGVEWAALTNGRELQFFNTFLKPDLSAKRVLSIDLLGYSSDEEFDSLIQQLSQLSRQSITTRSANSWLTQRRMDATLRTVLLDPNSATIRAMRKALNDEEIKVTGLEIVHWARTHLASKAAAVNRPPTPQLPPITPTPREDESAAGAFNPLDSRIFQGSHQYLLPTFQALQACVETTAPGAKWRVTKYYIAAEYEGKTFLAIERRAQSLVIGLTLPETARSPLFYEEPTMFNWGRITKVFRVSKVDDVTDEVSNVIQQAIQHATSGTGGRKQHFGITLHQILSAGLLTPGERLTLKKGGATITEARLDPSGKIEWQGQLHASPSDPAFTQAVGYQSMNGWTYWFVERDGSLVSLAALRQEFTGRGLQPSHKQRATEFDSLKDH